MLQRGAHEFNPVSLVSLDLECNEYQAKSGFGVQKLSLYCRSRGTFLFNYPLNLPCSWRLKTCLCSRTGQDEEDLIDAAHGLRRFGLLIQSFAQHGNADQQEEEGVAGQ